LGIKGSDVPWVYSSGCRGLRKITLPLADRKSPPAFYRVELFFADEGATKAGERVFDVKLQGKTVLRNFDIVRIAGGPGKALVKTFRNVKAADTLVIELAPKAKTLTSRNAPILNGIKVLRLNN